MILHNKIFASSDGWCCIKEQTKSKEYWYLRCRLYFRDFGLELEKKS
jgi:hypothetical protein